MREDLVSSPSACVIVDCAHAMALRRRLEHDPDVTVYSESESLDALRLILENPPKILVLGAGIVKTARGALIVSRLKDHPAVDIRVLLEDDAKLPVLMARQDIALHAASVPLESCGTRAANRFTMKPDVEVLVDGEHSRLLDLSVTGAQLVLQSRVQPRQTVRLTLMDEWCKKRFRALVAWSTAELTQSIIKYRAGVIFVEPDTSAIEMFCRRNAMTASHRGK